MKILRAALYLVLSILTLLVILRPLFLTTLLNLMIKDVPGLNHPYDWFAHALAFAMLYVFVYLFLSEIGANDNNRRRIWEAGILVVLAAVDEITQHPGVQNALKLFFFSRPGREASFFDWFADVIGITTAMFAVSRCKTWRCSCCQNNVNLVVKKESDSQNDRATIK